MKAFIAAVALAVVVAPAFAQQPAPAPTTAGPARIYTDMPAGATVNNFYKQSVYDPSDNKIGDVEDVLIDTPRLGDDHRCRRVPWCGGEGRGRPLQLNSRQREKQ